MNSFNVDLERGKKGETAIKELLCGRAWEVQDVSNNQEFFSKDIDFIITKNNDTRTIEVKTDSRMSKTGNIFIETVSNMEARRKGWIYYTEAEFLFYVDINNGVCYCFRTKDIKELIKNRNFKKAYCYDSNKTVEGLLININFLIDTIQTQILYI